MNATLDSATTTLDLPAREAPPSPRQDALGPAAGVVTGLLTGSVLWLALASFVFTLLRGPRLFAF